MLLLGLVVDFELFSKASSVELAAVKALFGFGSGSDKTSVEAETAGLNGLDIGLDSS